MATRRFADITGIGLDVVAAMADGDPSILRLENLDTDLPVAAAVIEETRRSLTDDDNNSWLPLTGRMELRRAIAARLLTQTGITYDPSEQIVVTCGGMEGLLDALLATTDPGDEVILTDPTYVGMINRVRMVGAVPVLVPFRPDVTDRGRVWTLDLDRLERAVTDRTRALFVMNPSMPSGAVLDQEAWALITRICTGRDLPLIYNAAMERILYDDRTLVHPATLPGMAERTLIVGSVSKESRMIGWKVGWVAGPRPVMEDVGKAHLYNSACPVGIAQTAAAIALTAPEEDFSACLNEWQRRRDLIVSSLPGYEIIPAAGGWSMLLDVGVLGFDSVAASQRLMTEGRIAATYMRDWGKENGDRFVRLVFSNEPTERLTDIAARFQAAFGR